MKLLVFAHTPPPHHGQSVMVQLMLEGWGGDWRDSRRTGNLTRLSGDEHGIECYHVNARVSDDLQDVGGLRMGKVFRLLGYCAQAIWLRLWHQADTLYYIPAPAKKSAVLRDWLALSLLRPWFRRVVFHWHAFGLGHWTADQMEYPAGTQDVALRPPELFGRWESLARLLTRQFMGGADLSVVLTRYNQKDAAFLRPREIAVVANGIADPCPDFAETVLPARLARLQARQAFLTAPADLKRPAHLQVLFLSHCTREKGLFAALDLFAAFRREMPLAARLVVAGEFMREEERKEFDARVQQPDLEGAVEYLGFIGGEKKHDLLAGSDLLLFPTHYAGEALSLILLEVAAYGLPSLVSRWRGLAEVADDPRAVLDGASALESVEKMKDLLNDNPFQALRDRFANHYERSLFVAGLAEALLQTDQNSPK